MKSVVVVRPSTPRLTLNDSKLVVFSGDRLYDPWLAPLLVNTPQISSGLGKHGCFIRV